MHDSHEHDAAAVPVRKCRRNMLVPGQPTVNPYACLLLAGLLPRKTSRSEIAGGARDPGQRPIVNHECNRD